MRLELVPEPRSENGLRETDEEALIRMLLEAEVKTPTADEGDCRRYYKSNLARFRSPDLYEPLHILFKAPQDDKAAYAEAVERAEGVLRDVKAAPACFESLARTLSDCPSATEGGRLGQVAEGDTTPEFEDALRSSRRWRDLSGRRAHPLRRACRPPGPQGRRGVLPFEQVRERIASYLEASSSRRAAAQYRGVAGGSGADQRV